MKVLVWPADGSGCGHTSLFEMGPGLVLQVDTADVPLIAGFNWRLLRTRGQVYAQSDHGRMTILMHRLILGAGDGDLVDHENGDGLDNRRANLRLATKAQNAANSRPQVGGTSRHKGVSWKSERSKWVANIHVDGKTRYLGSFDDEDAAARAYNRAAIEAWGDFARLNITAAGTFA